MKWTEWITSWTIVKKIELETLEIDREELVKQVDANAKAVLLIKSLKEEVSIKDKSNSVLIAQLNAKEPGVEDSEYWNNKWVKNKIYYSAPTKRNVLEYVEYREIPKVTEIANKIIEEYGLSKSNYDSIPLSWMKYKKIMFDSKQWKYVSDPKGKDLWRTPEETLELKYGDCDDFALLGHYVVRETFKLLYCWTKVKHRLKFVAGNVNRRGTIPSNAGGHAYGIWLYSDKEWMTIESTYYPEISIRNYGVLPQKYNPMYGNIWFSFNEEFSWGDHSIAISKKDFNKI